MVPEIEAIRGGARLEPTSNASARALDTTSSARAPAPRRRAAEAEVRPASSEVGVVFEVDRESRELVIKIVDRETHKVIREIPPEEIQALREAMQSVLGTFLDRQG
jgi:flagellar protein FlaG